MTAEVHRELVMKTMFATKSWQSCWPVWKTEIYNRTTGFTDAGQIYNLGSQLRDIFFLTNTGVRTQSSLSGGGAAWECLVCWYLNVVFSGTNAVAMRQSKKVVPAILLDATTISYGTTQTNTESDLCVVVYPPGFAFPLAGRGYKAALDLAVAGQLGNIELGIVQCKTSWADNAQIPMLWDMVYHANFGPGTHVKIGRNGASITHLKKFSYAFVVTPTQKTTFKPSLMPVKRVNSLSGGNYWGMPTKLGVAFEVAEIFTRNFNSAFAKPVQASIAVAIAGKIGLFA